MQCEHLFYVMGFFNPQKLYILIHGETFHVKFSVKKAHSLAILTTAHQATCFQREDNKKCEQSGVRRGFYLKIN